MSLRVWLPAVRTGSGIDVFTLRLAAALERAGVTPTIGWLHPSREFFPGVLLPAAPAGTDVVHANSWNAYAFAGRAPLVATANHVVLDPPYLAQATALQRAYYQGWVGPRERRSLAAAAVVTAMSEHTARSLATVYGFKGAHVILNWIDPSIFRPAPPRAEPRPFRLLFVGNLSRRKGADLLAPIARRLGSAFELRFTGGLRGSDAGLADLPANMTRVGPVVGEAGMAQLYADCDALLFPSRLEGFGYAPLEALACGRPVICSNSSSLPEVVRDGQTGLLCPVDDVDAFVTACRRLAEDRALYRALSAAASEDANRRFSGERAAQAYRQLYLQALERRAA